MQNVGARFHAVHVQQQAKNVAKVGEQGIVWRGMHARAHGCVQGTLQVATELPQYRYGIFATQGRTYQVTGRFSNGAGLIQTDSERDLRGFAVKVHSIDAPFLPQAVSPGDQDLLMTNGVKHHAANIVELMDFVEASAAGGVKYAAFLASHPVLASTLIQQTSRQVQSVLSETYWSRAAYTLGAGLSVKFLAQPCDPVAAGSNPNSSDPARLTKDFDDRFAQSAACFKLYAQPQENPISEPIENHQTEWRTPQVLLAQINFPAQTPDRSVACENLIFNPWNGHQEMRPLGNMNRGRKPIYSAAEGYRKTGDKSGGDAAAHN